MHTMQDAKDPDSEPRTYHTLEDTDENTIITKNASHVLHRLVVDNLVTYRPQKRTRCHQFYLDFRNATKMLTNSWSRRM